MTDDEKIPQISQGALAEDPPAPAAAADQRGPDGKFLPGNHAAGEHMFKPGVSGNPSGRPSTRRFTARLREALDRNDGEMTKAMVNVACQRALRGDFRYFKEILDRVEGKVLDQIAIEAEMTAHNVESRVVIVSFADLERERLSRSPSDTNSSA